MSFLWNSTPQTCDKDLSLHLKELSNIDDSAKIKEELELLKSLLHRGPASELELQLIEKLGEDTWVSIKLKCNQTLSSIHSFLLGDVFTNWIMSWTESEKESLVFPFFQSGSALQSFSALTKVLREVDPTQGSETKKAIALKHIQFVVLLIEKQFIEESSRRWQSLFNELAKQHTVVYKEILRSIISMPDRIANRLGKETPQCFTPRNYSGILIKDAFLALEKSNTSEMANLVSEIVNALITNGQSVSTILSILFGKAVRDNAVLRKLFTQTLLLTRSYNKAIAQEFVLFLHGQLIHTDFVSCVTQLVKISGDKHFLQNTFVKQIQYTNKAVLKALEFVDKEDIEETGLLVALMQHVETHMSSSIPAVRVCGMKVAEAFSPKIHPEPVKFEYVDPEEEEEYLSPPQPQPIELIETISHAKLDPDALFEVEDTVEDWDSADEENEMFNTFDEKSEPKPLSDKKIPVFIRETLISLREDDPDTVELALDALPNLIAMNPPDLFDVAEALVDLLIHLQDNYELNDFSRKRRTAIVALIDKVPKKCVAYLASQFFEANYSLHQRLEMLESLSEAAELLARGHLASLPSQPSQIVVKPVEEYLGKRTERFQHKPTPQTRTVNRFAGLVADFVQPLLRSKDGKPVSAQIGKMDATVLGKWVFTLGRFVEFAGQSATADMLQILKAVLEVCWIVRFHENAFARQSVFIAFLSVLTHTPPALLFDPELLDSVHDTVLWCQEATQRETDSECIQLGFACARKWNELLADNPQYAVMKDG